MEKEGSVDHLIHKGKKERYRSVQEDAIWTAQGVSHLSEGNKLKSQFLVISFFDVVLKVDIEALHLEHFTADLCSQ